MFRLVFLVTVACLSFVGPALAHFGMVIPSTSMVTEQGDGVISLDLSFRHPMAMTSMPLEKPKSFRVISGSNVEELIITPDATKLMDQKAWHAEYAIKRPGVYQFIMEPTPYWEPAEDCFIVNYTKTYVAALGAEEGWDAPAGLKTEIVPLTRPFGNYSGNVFQGQVFVDGKPAPGLDVEVEFYNRDGRYAPPNDYFVTQVVKTDGNGVFVYGVPFAGWWGFAALSTAAEKLEHDGEPKDVELGAVLWVEFLDPVRR